MDQEQPDLHELDRYASVFSTPSDAKTTSEHPQPSATSTESTTDGETTSPTLAPTSDFRSPTLNPQPSATSSEASTDDLPRYANLTSQQTLAMYALQTGQTISEAADTAQTEPATVNQWLRGDCTFQAAMNRCGCERRQSIHARLALLASRAADLVDHQIRQGNGRLAVRLLRGLGYLGGAKGLNC